jgi:O-antigen/teichoic acid export membrane protein
MLIFCNQAIGKKTLLFNIKSRLLRITKGEFASRSLLYLFINGTNAAIPFLMLPILTHYLSPKEYGIWGLFIAITSFLTPLASLGLDNAVGRKYFDLPQEDFRKYIGTTLIINTAVFIITAIFIFLNASWIRSIANLPGWWVYAVPFFVFANMVVGKIQTFAVTAHRPIFYSCCVLGNRLIQNGIVLILLIVMAKGVDSLLTSYLISLYLVLFSGIFWLYKIGYLKLHFSKAYAKHALGYGIPLIPYTLGLTVIDMSDRFFIEKMLGIEAVGIYTVAGQISAAFMLVLSSILMSWCPWVLKRMKTAQSHQDKLLIVKATYILLGGIVILSILLSFILPVIADLFVSKHFADAKTIIPWLTAALGCFGLYQILYIFLIHAEKTWTIAKFVLMAFVFDLLMNYFLIQENGLAGAAQARICAYIFMFICASVWIARNTDLPWGGKIPKHFVEK